MKYILFQTLIVSIVCVKFCFVTNEKRIIGGEEAPPDKYRWAVSIKGNVDKLKVAASCGASILQTEGKIQWLVTAAHCFYPFDGVTIHDLTKPKYWHIRVGLTKVDFIYKKHGFKDKVKEKVKSLFDKAYKKLFGKHKFKVAINDLHIKKLFVHPGYVATTVKSDDPNVRMDNDIALMKLKEPLPVDELTGVSTINLPSSAVDKSWPANGTDCIVVGWGCTAPNQAANPIAKLAVLKIWKNKECEKAFPMAFYINPTSDFCAGYLKKTYGLCQGDSGSGLICDYKGVPTVAGVVSRGHGGNPGEYPAVFTRVSFFSKWIRDIIEKN